MSSDKNTFSWTEWLVLIAVLGFLGAVLVPFINRSRSSHGRSVDASNLRQIGQASLIYANDNREQLPGLNLTQAGEIEEGATTPDIHAIAAALARGGGLNDASMWTFSHDRHPDVNRTGLTGVVLEHGSPRTLSPGFARSALSVQFVAGLNTEMKPTTPIAFTRGLQSDGRWAKDKHTSVYGSEGGYIVFLGGNVNFFRDLRDSGGQLTTSEGARTANILETIGSEHRIFSEPATPTGALDGMPGGAP